MPSTTYLDNTPQATVHAAHHNRITDQINVYSARVYGAYGDGASHPLSNRFATLGAAQAVYPHAVSLTDEEDWAGIVAATNAAKALSAQYGGFVGVELSGTGQFRLNRKVVVGGATGSTDRSEGVYFIGNRSNHASGKATFKWTGTTLLVTPTTSAPTQSATGGTLTAATYSYRVSAINADGETIASVAQTVVVASGTTNTVTVPWSVVSGATGYKVYGRTSGSEKLLATVGAVTSWDDTGSATPTYIPPYANTTGGCMFEIRNVYKGAFRNCSFDGNGYADYAWVHHVNGDTNTCQGWAFEDCTFVNGAAYGVRVGLQEQETAPAGSDCCGLLFKHCWFERTLIANAAANYPVAHSHARVRASEAFGIVFDTCWFDSDTDQPADSISPRYGTSIQSGTVQFRSCNSIGLWADVHMDTDTVNSRVPGSISAYTYESQSQRFLYASSVGGVANPQRTSSLHDVKNLDAHYGNSASNESIYWNCPVPLDIVAGHLSGDINCAHSAGKIFVHGMYFDDVSGKFTGFTDNVSGFWHAGQHNNAAPDYKFHGRMPGYTEIPTGGRLLCTGSSIQTAMGANTAGANDLTLSGNANVWPITGTTTINRIASTNWQAGAQITLLFSTAITVHHGQASSAPFRRILLAGAVDFVASVSDTLTLVYDGADWREISRAVI